MLKALTRLSVAAGAAATLAGAAQAAPGTFLGDIQLEGFNFCPRGTLEAAGQLLPINQNQALFSLYGTTYGGDGRTTFALPDLRGRVAVGYGAGPRLGTRTGEETRTLTVANMPAHNHRVNTGTSGVVTNPTNASITELPVGVDVFSVPANPTGSTMNSAMIANTGGGQAFDIIMPTLAMKWCVTTQGTFPPRN
ncbi:tail fiber protein [Maricaulis sp.]|uniref:phage tail protein n=1 Tax=Maricaulis sp. TaxID=1486257 RepID=UPI0026380658|nr:tail fiber protein [Maricaulis sp.]